MTSILQRLCVGSLVAVAALAACAAAPATSQAAPCDAPIVSPVACENTKAGTPQDDWEIDGAGDDSLQGFATQMSVNKGETVSFKIKSTSTAAYHIDILRLGYYGGDGARKVASNLAPTGTSTQPACQSEASTGLIDCGNWAVSRTWTVPSDAVSGVYIAHLVRNSDPNIESHIKFVVRDDARELRRPSTRPPTRRGRPTTATAATASTPATRSAPRATRWGTSPPTRSPTTAPDNSEQDSQGSALFGGAEYSMIRFLEASGYDVSYISGVDTHARGPLLLNHKLFLSSGHDEYWSKTQRTNVEAARDAGVNLAFFSGNEMFWKTRFESSIAGAATANRTLVSYKDTHFTEQQDPVAWTGTWRDPRFAVPADGVTPENALTGQSFVVNSGTARIVGARRLPPAAPVAQHGRRPDVGPEHDARPRHARLRVGRRLRQRLPPSGLVQGLRDDRQRRRVVHRLRQHHEVQHHRDAQHDALPRAQRRAGVRRRHGAVGLGPR